MKIIFLELNEVPNLILQRSFKKHKYKVNLEELTYTKTISLDKGHLSPWITWETLHRGVTNDIHKRTDINQCPDQIINDYPTIDKTLVEEGFKVGVLGSFSASNIPEKILNKYQFFLPNVFLSEFNCKPKGLKQFVKFNQLMTLNSGRNVSNYLPNFLLTFKSLYSFMKNTIYYRSIYIVIKQIISEIFDPWKKVRRRTVQSDILFDLFLSLQYKYKPDFSIFFTNHVASSMHRFWQATFPIKGKKTIDKNKWINTYKNEIDHSMSSSCFYINKLINYVQENKDTQLWILSSMGQDNLKLKPRKSFDWRIKNMKIFVESLIQKKISLETKNQMFPIYSFHSSNKTIKEFSETLEKYKFNITFKIRSQDQNSVNFILKCNGKEQIKCQDKETGEEINLLGLEKFTYDEKSVTTGYHVPEGILYRYGENLLKVNNLLNENNYLSTDKIRELALKTIRYDK